MISLCDVCLCSFCDAVTCDLCFASSRGYCFLWARQHILTGDVFEAEGGMIGIGSGGTSLSLCLSLCLSVFLSLCCLPPGLSLSVVFLSI